MKPTKGKLCALSCVVVGVVLLAATGFALRNSMAVEWYSYRLRTASEDEKWSVAERLAELGKYGKSVAIDWYAGKLRSREKYLEQVSAATKLARLGAVTDLLDALAANAMDPLPPDARGELSPTTIFSGDQVTLFATGHIALEAIGEMIALGKSDVDTVAELWNARYAQPRSR